MGLLGRLVPVLALMGLIFYLSDQPDLSSGLGGWDLYLRKAAHMTEYALLYVLLLRALRWRWPALAAGLAVAYAATDEWHQTAVAGRHGTPRDVVIDAVGIAIGALAVWLVQRRLARHRTVMGR